MASDQRTSPGGSTGVTRPAPARPTQHLTLTAILAVTIGLALAPATMASDRSIAPDATDCQMPVLTPARSDASGPSSVSLHDLDLSDGSWRRIARAPFGSAYGPAVWTGERMIVVQADGKRSAAYDPTRDRWREVERAPRRVEPFAPYAWTGDELLIAEIAADGSSLGGLAYEPATDRWRELERLSLSPDDGDHALADAIWTGTHMVVVEGLGLVAAYDVGGDCWVELGRVPGDGFAWHLYESGSSLLVESRERVGGVTMHAFDPVSASWSAPAVSQLDVGASESGGVWVDDSLLFVSWAQSGDSTGRWHAMFDPGTSTWSSVALDCRTDAYGTVEAGDLLVASDGRRALKPGTRTCVHLPAPPRRLNGTESMVWTGSELIAWSGIRSPIDRELRSGLALRARTTWPESDVGRRAGAEIGG